MKRIVLAAMTPLLCALATTALAQESVDSSGTEQFAAVPAQRPMEMRLQRAHSSNIDLRSLPQVAPQKFLGLDRPAPEPHPAQWGGGAPSSEPNTATPATGTPAGGATTQFDGLDYATWGSRLPPAANGDAGPVYYIQAISSSLGIFRKSDGVRVAAFTFNTFMSQGAFGNVCDTDNFGDPVVLYDTFEDRWIVTDYAFKLDGSSNIINPPGQFQCFAVSKTGDPVSGGWNFYSINTVGGFGEYPKLGVWSDGIYMSANILGYPVWASAQNPRVYALNKAQMYAGAPTVQMVSFNAPASEFTLLPSNARLQTGTPPAGRPAFFVATWQFLNAVTVYKFHVDWTVTANSTFTGPDVPLAATSWPNAAVAQAPSLGGNTLDPVQIRAMAQNQYSNFGGVESLWTTHTVRRANTTGFAAPRWYQVDISGGNVAANLPQAATWDPDGANVMHRFVPSLALDRAGDMALGYSTSSSTTKPAIKYAGRLAADPINTFSQVEQTLIQGIGTQLGNCNGAPCAKWGDYSSMTLDPDGCTFWYTNEYYATDGLLPLTRIGRFNFPGCATVGAGGTVSGTVTALAGGAPLSGAVVMLGSRSTTTNGSGNYSFSAIPAGTYPTMSVSFPGCISGSANSIAVVDSATTTQDFALAGASTSACLTDTTQTDFQTGTATNLDLATSAGDVTLSNADIVDQQNSALGTSGVGITITTWGGQAFTPAITGTLKRVDVNLFCSGCSGTIPNLTLSIRATSGGLPTGADLATATITGFNSGVATYYTANFAAPIVLNAGTQYAFAVRPTANPSPGTYALTRTGTPTAGGDVYAGGTRVSGATSGTVWSIPLTGGISTDTGFKIYINNGYGPGNYVSAVKDANPSPSSLPTWTLLSWNGATPANTTLQFQVAASNSANGPFNFVGPDSTAGTFFTSSGASLSQFNGLRYLKYKAYLATTDSGATPTLSDATVCFVNLPPPELSVTKSDGGASVAPGGTVAYTLTYSNTGIVQNATGVVLAETVPASTTFNAGASTAGWSCTPNNNAGATCTLAIGSVAAGSNGSATFAATVVNPVAAGVAQISTTASVADDGTHGADATPANNSATDTTPVNAAPDLRLIKSDGDASVAPGATVAYALSYANTGDRGASGVVLTETVPANTVFNAGASTAGWVCAPDDNAGSTCTRAIGGLAAASGGSSATFAVTVNAALSPSVTQISNTASIADDGNNGADPTPVDNTSSDTTPITGADLSITKSDGVTQASPGGNAFYTIVASNAGPNAVNGATVADLFPSTLICAWTCSGTPGGTCAASGNGAINDNSVNLAVNASVTYVANCSISSLANGSLTNTATVATPAGVTDPKPGNNSASDTDALFTSANVGVTVSDNRNYVRVGDSLNYVIEVSNAGPSTAQTTLIDTLPAQLTGGSWVCSGTGGATCSGGSGNTLNSNATVPSGGKATYVYSATVASAGGDLINNSALANVTVGTDPQPSNNSAADQDIVVIFKDGFEGTSLTLVSAVGDGADFVTGQLRVNPSLLGQLGIVPVAVASGQSNHGKTLFTVELARFGNDVALRAVLRNDEGLSERTPWQAADLRQQPLNFDWQSASGDSHDGYLLLGGDDHRVGAVSRGEQDRLMYLRVGVDHGLPWLRVNAH